MEILKITGIRNVSNYSEMKSEQTVDVILTILLQNNKFSLVRRSEDAN